MVVEVVGGLMSGSLALLADAGHMLTDAASLALAFFAVRFSKRPADAQRSFGYDRMQVLAAFVNGLSLCVMSVWIAVEAVIRLLSPVQVLAGAMLWIAVGGLIVNILAFAVLHVGDSSENVNLRGAAAHVMGDLLGSVAAIAAALIIMFTNWMLADPLLSVLVAALIARTGWRLARETGHILLEGAPDNVDMSALQQRLQENVGGLRGIHHVHMWCLTPERRIMTLHAVLEDQADSDESVEQISRILRKEARIDHVTVQVERGRCVDAAIPPHSC